MCNFCSAYSETSVIFAFLIGVDSSGKFLSSSGGLKQALLMVCSQNSMKDMDLQGMLCYQTKMGRAYS